MSQEATQGTDYPVRPPSPSEFEDFQQRSLAESSEFGLRRLPDVLFPHLCSFLTTRAVYRLAATCCALSRLCFPSTVLIHSRKDLLCPEEQPPQQTDRCSKALGTLMRRGAGRLKELFVKELALLEPLLRAMRTAEPAVQLGLLTSLHIVLISHPAETRHAAQPTNAAVGGMLVDMLGELPMLQALHVMMYEAESLLSPLWDALREGACPKLERLVMEGCSPAVLVGLASALPSRPEGCARLKTLTIEVSGKAPCEGLDAACQALLACLAPDSLEELCVWHPAEFFKAAVARLSTCEWPALRVLDLSAKAVTDERECDALLYALCGDALANLMVVEIADLRSSDEAWRALGEAMATGPCLRRLKELGLRRVFRGPEQMELFMRGVGTGHGCPDLQLLALTPYHAARGRHDEEETDWSPLAHALQPPHGLPRLHTLRLTSSCRSRIGALMEALEHRSHAVEPLRQVSLSMTGGMVDPPSPSSLVGALADGGALARLQELQILPSDFDEAGSTASWIRQLMEVLEAGGGKQLTTIQWNLPPEGAEASDSLTSRLLRALVEEGACPRLYHLDVKSPWRMQDVGTGAGLDMGLLQALLTGGAACSATLRGVTLLSCGLGAADLTVLESCMRDPRVVQLDILELRVTGGDALPALLSVFDALGHGRAGARLKHLNLYTEGWTKSQAMEAVQRLVDIIDAGGLPTFALQCSPIGSGPVIMLNARIVGQAELQQAVKSRAVEVWRASW